MIGALLLAGAVGISTLISNMIAANAKKQAAQTQSDAATEALTMQKDSFSKIQETFKPYVDAGSNAARQQEALTGALGPEAQQEAIANIESGPQFTAMMQQGENAILQNASATGGLRGGNTQGALAEFRPTLLSGMIDQRFNQLGGIADRGLSAVGGAANASLTGTGMISDTIGQRGAAQAGGKLAEGEFWASVPGSIMESIGLYRGLRGGGAGKGSI